MGTAAVVRAFEEIRAALAVLDAQVGGALLDAEVVVSVAGRSLWRIRWLLWRKGVWTFWPVPGRLRRGSRG
jgi:hypothetical protein